MKYYFGYCPGRSLLFYHSLHNLNINIHPVVYKSRLQEGRKLANQCYHVWVLAPIVNSVVFVFFFFFFFFLVVFWGGGGGGGELSEPLFRGVGSKGNLFCGGDVGNKVSKDKIR